MEYKNLLTWLRVSIGFLPLDFSDGDFFFMDDEDDGGDDDRQHIVFPVFSTSK